ncbi:MAG: flavodoxin [Actinobacteria bacterium]|nr:flavodoxin [Actinomycetota bacterium]
MKTLVAYLSQTGNTKKVAEAIYSQIPEEKEMKELGELEDLEGYDLCFIGFPVHAGNPAVVAKEFLEKNGAGKKVVLFVTHATPEGEEDLPACMDICRAAAASAELVGFFNCQGELDQKIAELLLKSDSPRHQEFGRRAPETKGQPDETRLEKAKAFARDVIEKAGA